ncbi:MAG: CRISPR system precrRNA processing endoribonuclease RAMP protein Cas6 [Candidatus Rokuibacteriota bacterium]
MSHDLALARYRVTLEALEPLVLPAYLGSTLRGAFGRAFRALCCPGRDGEPCPVPGSCPYHLVFETSPPPGADALRTHDEIPRPFVIAPPPASAPAYPAGSEVAFDLTLIGRAREFFPHFVVTLREVDRIGRGRRAVTLRRMAATHPLTGAAEPVYDSVDNLVRPHDLSVTLADCFDVACPGDAARISFVTQTRLKHEGGFARRPEFHVFFRRLLGRLSSLARFHGPGPLDLDFRDLIERARSVALERDETRWTVWSRYSGRQDRRMEWEGLTGTVVYRGDLKPFWPYVLFGQWAHVGSNTTFGLGGYRMEAPAPGDEGEGGNEGQG